MVSTFTSFAFLFLASFAVSRFGRTAPAPLTLWAFVGIVALIALIAVLSIALGGGWSPAVAVGAAVSGIVTGQWLGGALRKPSPD
jgi:hypothetical protein